MMTAAALEEIEGGDEVVDGEIRRNNPPRSVSMSRGAVSSTS